MQRSLCPRAGQSHNPAPGLASGGCLLNTAHGSAWGRVTFTPQPWLLCASCGCSRNVAARAGNREQGGVRQHNENGHQGKSGGSEQRRTAGQSDRGVKHHSVPPSQSTAPLTPKVRRAVTTHPHCRAGQLLHTAVLPLQARHQQECLLSGGAPPAAQPHTEQCFFLTAASCSKTPVLSSPAAPVLGTATLTRWHCCPTRPARWSW